MRLLLHISIFVNVSAQCLELRTTIPSLIENHSSIKEDTSYFFGSNNLVAKIHP
ncbi:hypothetical protein MtrunA17_Chr5g0401241 [Medicago truncatula]|uniref:Transmembrane protein n=1 Tax=Medicago truncatula TaxID=3880 RepID=A0A396HPY3_MEDTR|nr:hypothetical protein MtrunA17_Chr5g0401241 [Medicago truncatula]